MDIIRNDNILDAIEDIIGPTSWGLFFCKNANDARFVSGTRIDLLRTFPTRDMGVWCAFSPSNVESGCMRFIPGTHDKAFATTTNWRYQQSADEGPDDPRRGRRQSRRRDPAARRTLVHHGVVHGSNPNNADHPRVGISIHYIAPHVHQVLLKAYGHMVRGSDRHGHWREDPEPRDDFDPVCIEPGRDLRRIPDRRRQILGTLSKKNSVFASCYRSQVLIIVFPSHPREHEHA